VIATPPAGDSGTPTAKPIFPIALGLITTA